MKRKKMCYLKNYNIDASATFKLYEPAGCEKCNMTGYKGRIGIFEAIKTNEAIEKIIPQNPSEREIKKIAKTQGILSMRQNPKTPKPLDTLAIQNLNDLQYNKRLTKYGIRSSSGII